MNIENKMKKLESDIEGKLIQFEHYESHLQKDAERRKKLEQSTGLDPKIISPLKSKDKNTSYKGSN